MTCPAPHTLGTICDECGCGILHGLTYEEYEKIDAWRWSLIKILHDGSPHALQWTRANPNAGDTPARAKLRAIHALAFEPENFERDYSTTDQRRGTLGFKLHQRLTPGRTVLKQKEYDEAKATADAVRSHKAVVPLLKSGAPEVVVVWRDGPTGLLCKGRMDWLGPLGMLDLKTLGTVHEQRVASMILKALYHAQQAHYMDGLAANGITGLPAYIIAAEGGKANEVALYEVDPGVPDGALYVGAHVRAGLMAKLAECVRDDHWPQRHEEGQTLVLPEYGMIDYEVTPSNSEDEDERSDPCPV